jgi:hypothetical protein
MIFIVIVGRVVKKTGSDNYFCNCLSKGINNLAPIFTMEREMVRRIDRAKKVFEAEKAECELFNLPTKETIYFDQSQEDLVKLAENNPDSVWFNGSDVQTGFIDVLRRNLDKHKTGNKRLLRGERGVRAGVGVVLKSKSGKIYIPTKWISRSSFYDSIVHESEERLLVTDISPGSEYSFCIGAVEQFRFRAEVPTHLIELDEYEYLPSGVAPLETVIKKSGSFRPTVKFRYFIISPEELTNRVVGEIKRCEGSYRPGKLDELKLPEHFGLFPLNLDNISAWAGKKKKPRSPVELYLERESPSDIYVRMKRSPEHPDFKPGEGAVLCYTCEDGELELAGILSGVDGKQLFYTQETKEYLIRV